MYAINQSKYIYYMYVCLYVYMNVLWLSKLSHDPSSNDLIGCSSRMRRMLIVRVNVERDIVMYIIEYIPAYVCTSMYVLP